MPDSGGPPYKASVASADSELPGDVSFFDISAYSFQETGLYTQLAQRFIAEHEDMDVFFERREFVLGKKCNSIYSIADKIKSVLTDARAVMPFNNGVICITGQCNIQCRKKPVFIWVSVTETNEAVEIKIDIMAPEQAAVDMAAYIDKSFNDEKLAVIKWWNYGRHGEATREFYLPDDGSKLHPEFYPDLSDPTKYLQEYMDSDEAILLIAGPPGTGKTTLLRRLILDHKLVAHVVYDEIIMKNDAVFQSFLFDEKRNGQSDIMIIEDADTILSAREDDGNKLMSRFLNVSDGLIKLPNKKLVFTTNIMDFNRVDQALLRPGRCFGVMHTRELDLNEAQAAAKVAELPIPTEKRLYTLAELFNQGKRVKVRTIGFGARH